MDSALIDFKTFCIEILLALVPVVVMLVSAAVVYFIFMAILLRHRM